MKSNIDLVTDLMTYSKHGLLSQIFVVAAIEYYAKHVIKLPLPTTESTNIINAEAWKAVAQDVQERMNEFYERPDHA